MNPNIKVAVGFAVTEMLESLRGQGLFGKDASQDAEVFSAIASEIGDRQTISS